MYRWSVERHRAYVLIYSLVYIFVCLTAAAAAPLYITYLFTVTHIFSAALHGCISEDKAALSHFTVTCSICGLRTTHSRWSPQTCDRPPRCLYRGSSEAQFPLWTLLWQLHFLLLQHIFIQKKSSNQSFKGTQQEEEGSYSLTHSLTSPALRAFNL